MVGPRPGQRRTAGARTRPAAQGGYLVIMLMMAVFAITLGFLIAVPVWQTEVKREKEEELIFRGKQYVEAVRLYVLKNPGRFPASLKELLDKKCIRRLYKDPMSATGEWNVILNVSSAGLTVQAGAGGASENQVYVVPEKSLPS
ncbi:MAG TPA: hypothetical protein VEG35_01540, partial [Burkholderiales bacterium]|nr:hypothetical protein [Burkholderiales bacterium]